MPKRTSKELQIGGLYKSANGFVVRVYGRTPEGVAILIQYHKGAPDRELGVYGSKDDNSLPFEVIRESPIDEAENDF